MLCKIIRLYFDNSTICRRITQLGSVYHNPSQTAIARFTFYPSVVYIAYQIVQVIANCYIDFLR